MVTQEDENRVEELIPKILGPSRNVGENMGIGKKELES
jgi:hypothetical protein